MAAVPAIAVALFLVIEGGPMFTFGLFVLGCVCMHELYAMYERAHPVRLAGFLALAGLLLAALYGGQFQVLLVAVMALPVLFGLTLVQRAPSVGALAMTLLGIYWIGFALAHAVLLRGACPTARGSSSTCSSGRSSATPAPTSAGGCSARRPLAPSISPNKTVEGLVIGMVCAVLAVWIAGRYQEWLPGTHALVLGLGVAVAAPIGDLFESFSSGRRGPRTPAACSARTAARWTGSTRCCSPRSPATTSGGAAGTPRADSSGPARPSYVESVRATTAGHPRLDRLDRRPGARRRLPRAPEAS